MKLFFTNNQNFEYKQQKSDDHDYYKELKKERIEF